MGKTIEISGKQVLVETVERVAAHFGKSFGEAIIIIAKAISEYERVSMAARIEAERKKIEAIMEEMDYCYEDEPTHNITIKRHTDPRNKRNCKPIKGYKQQSAWLRTRSNPKLR